MTSVLAKYLAVRDTNAIRVAGYALSHSKSYSEAARRLKVNVRTLIRWRAKGGPLYELFPVQDPSQSQSSRRSISADGRTFLYAIMRNDRIVYIGQTKRPSSRPMNHLCAGIGDEAIVFRAYEKNEDALAAESRAIMFLRSIGVELRNVDMLPIVRREFPDSRVSVSLRRQ